MNMFGSLIENMMKQALHTQTSEGAIEMPIRPRRNRSSPAMRALIQETRLDPAHFISPLFVQEGSNIKSEIKSLPDVFRFSIDTLNYEIDALLAAGIHTVNLFCYTQQCDKDPKGSKAVEKDNLLQRAIRALKTKYPELIVMADIALDPFTDHGHDGIINEQGHVLNDPSVAVLSEMALLAAEAGADFVSPSDMMDGRVAHIRRSLDANGLSHVGIMAYSAKYASSFYGPFRDALDSAPAHGDKKSYQLSCANSREAIRECLLDAEEGADLLLIKPALSNLDIITKVRAHTQLPIGAYQVSGEYAVLKAAHERGWIHFDTALIETLLSIKRAGADFIITYAAKQASAFIKSGL